MLESGAGNIQGVADAMQMEAIAALRGLERAAGWGMPRIVLETDATNPGRALTTAECDDSPGGSLFRHIKHFMLVNFSVCQVSVCSRTCNKVADYLAAHGSRTVPTGEHVMWCSAPSFVSNLVSGDLPEVT